MAADAVEAGSSEGETPSSVEESVEEDDGEDEEDEREEEGLGHGAVQQGGSLVDGRGEDVEDEGMDEWLCCERCSHWHIIPDTVTMEDLPDAFECGQS